MMDHEDWVAAVEAGYDVGFSAPAPDLPERDGMDLGDERHQAWVIGLESGRAAGVEAARVEAEHLTFFEERVRPVVAAVVADMGRGTHEQIRTASHERAEAAGEANRAAAVPWMEPAEPAAAPDLPSVQVARYRSQSREHTPYVSHRAHTASREMHR